MTMTRAAPTMTNQTKRTGVLVLACVLATVTGSIHVNSPEMFGVALICGLVTVVLSAAFIGWKR